MPMNVNLPLKGDAISVTEVDGEVKAATIVFVHPRGQADGLPPWVDASLMTTPTTNEQARLIVVNSIPYRDDATRFNATKPFWVAA